MMSSASATTPARDAGTPRSGIGNRRKSMPLATAVAASPSKPNCASSSGSSNDTTTSMPDSRHATVSSANQSPPRGRSRMPSVPGHGPTTQNTFGCIVPNRQTLGRSLREAVRRCQRHAHARRRADGPVQHSPVRPWVALPQLCGSDSTGMKRPQRRAGPPNLLVDRSMLVQLRPQHCVSRSAVPADPPRKTPEIADPDAVTLVSVTCRVTRGSRLHNTVKNLRPDCQAPEVGLPRAQRTPFR